ncbi:MAG: hypothetical protein ACLTDF_02515 [Coprococcus sp.]
MDSESTIRADIEAIQEKVGMDFVIFIVDSSTDLSDIGMYIVTAGSWQVICVTITDLAGRHGLGILS